MNVINKIRKDGIHVLVDLSGHSEKNRLPIFINKPAPVQVSWAGYPGSTGIAEIDYLIGDPFVTPENMNGHFTEKIFRLPNIWVCFTAPDFDVQISDLPVIKNGYVTFGSFNHLSKINDEVISLWSKILKSIPKSKIFLKTKQLNNSYLKEKIISKFKENGINLNSIILEEGTSRSKLLNSYNKVDIALDPFPYSGGVTSLEAIWMGVPVLTKKGFKFASRTTESIIHNSGMSDWVANDENEYVKKAIKFSTNLELLTGINKSLRQVALESPLFNSTLFAKQLNNAFWEMWNNFILKV
jgi:predicted O-linked N-acetylglucosamine transferase (SPINDLY family)